ncbi:MAG: type II toxin-antitoxin system RelE/ParE family toxin [Acidobacteriota bacterium]
MGNEVKLMKEAAEFIDALPIKMKAKVLRTINLLEEFGRLLPGPHSQTVKGYPGLKELRVKLGSDICRIFYFHSRQGLFILTSGYVKKEMKLKHTEIDRAVRLMKLYLEEQK